MASKKLIDLLNEAIARELSVSVQYMWHHIMAKGMKSPEIRDRLRAISITEMKHAEEIAERLDYLGGIPTTKPSPIELASNLEEIIEQNLAKEEDAIKLYKNIIKVAQEENDSTTRTLFEKILSDEEDHHGEFKNLLEDN